MPMRAWVSVCSDPSVTNVRLTAARVLAQVLKGSSLSEVLAVALESIPSGDRAFLQALCFTSVRQYHRLAYILNQLLKKPIKDEEIHALALIGLAQLAFMAVKSHAAVAETVSAARRKQWAKPLLNALLRHYLRRQQSLESMADRDFVAAYSHPAWLRHRIESCWPEQAKAVLEANNRQAPMTLRLNLSRIERDSYCQQLACAGLSARPIQSVDSAVELERAVAVQDLPGFAQGLVSVQDAASQIAAPLLQVKSGMRVLDVCAAPGGKTGHILETCPRLEELVAVDVSDRRLIQVRENLARLEGTCPVRLIHGDAKVPDEWWDGRRFDRILVDAPCSATGVVRRHPDIKLLRRDEDIAALAKIQKEILDAVWPLLADEGVMVYSTCSILQEENEQQICSFVDAHADARPVPLHVSWGKPVGRGRQILPGEMDGFYYAKVEKCAAVV